KSYIDAEKLEKHVKPAEKPSMKTAATPTTTKEGKKREKAYIPVKRPKARPVVTKKKDLADARGKQVKRKSRLVSLPEVPEKPATTKKEKVKMPPPVPKGPSLKVPPPVPAGPVIKPPAKDLPSTEEIEPTPEKKKLIDELDKDLEDLMND
ncbi:MAG: hypothetical protein ACTSRA_06480, partial [Promethearchaeota archaeon]